MKTIIMFTIILLFLSCNLFDTYEIVNKTGSDVEISRSVVIKDGDSAIVDNNTMIKVKENYNYNMDGDSIVITSRIITIQIILHEM